jgi:hypothetical protein
VRQAKLGASCRVQVPAGEGLANHPSQVWRMGRRCKNTERIIRSVHREPCRPQGNAHVPEVWDSLVRALKQTATVFTHRKPTQQQHFGERLEGLSGSSGRGMHGEKRRELGRPWGFLRPGRRREAYPTTRRTAEDLPGVSAAHSTSRQEVRGREEGADGVTKPAQATLSGHAGLEQTMPTSLQGRAKKAAHDTAYRFRHLFGMLTIA